MAIPAGTSSCPYTAPGDRPADQLKPKRGSQFGVGHVLAAIDVALGALVRCRSRSLERAIGLVGQKRAEGAEVDIEILRSKSEVIA